MRRVHRSPGGRAAPVRAGLSRATTEHVAGALRVLGELGGAATAEVDAARPGVTTVVGRSCPFGAVVAEHPEASALLAAFLEASRAGATVREVCHKEDAPHCRFELGCAPSDQGRLGP
jgi:hypothetical protein